MIALLRVSLVFCALGAGILHADVPWAGKLAPSAPGPFPMIPPFTGEFRFGWSNIDAASATAAFRRQGDRLTVDVSGGTTGLARTLWQIDAVNKTELLIPGLRSLTFDQREQYARRTTTTRAEWRKDGLWRLRQNRPGGRDEKWKRVKVEPIRDMVTGMLFVRSQPLANGDTVSLLMYPGDTPFFTEITVLGRETLRIAGKSMPAIRLDFRPQRIVRDDDRQYHLQPHRKFSRGTVWISDDRYRMPLRAEVDIFIGYVFGELKWAKFADGSILP